MESNPVMIERLFPDHIGTKVHFYLVRYRKLKLGIFTSNLLDKSKKDFYLSLIKNMKSITISTITSKNSHSKKYSTLITTTTMKEIKGLCKIYQNQNLKFENPGKKLLRNRKIFKERNLLKNLNANLSRK